MYVLDCITVPSLTANGSKRIQALCGCGLRSSVWRFSSRVRSRGFLLDVEERGKWRSRIRRGRKHAHPMLVIRKCSASCWEWRPILDQTIQPIGIERDPGGADPCYVSAFPSHFQFKPGHLLWTKLNFCGLNAKWVMDEDHRPPCSRSRVMWSASENIWLGWAKIWCIWLSLFDLNS